MPKFSIYNEGSGGEFRKDSHTLEADSFLRVPEEMAKVPWRVSQGQLFIVVNEEGNRARLLTANPSPSFTWHTGVR